MLKHSSDWRGAARRGSRLIGLVIYGGIEHQNWTLSFAPG
jgi:hypothetical protein